MAAKRERRQVHPGWPSFGPCYQVSQVWLGELEAGHSMHERGRISGREAQLARPDLDHLAGRPQAGQREGRISPRDEHDLGRRRQMMHGSDLVVAALILDHVVVVPHQDTGADSAPSSLRRMGSTDPATSGLRPKRGQDRIAVDLGASSLQGAHDLPPQAAGVIVAALQRNPGEPLALARAGTPLRHQSRLAEARRRVHEHQPGGGARQVASQLGPLYPYRSRTGRMELGRHRLGQARATGLRQGQNSARITVGLLPIARECVTHR